MGHRANPHAGSLGLHGCLRRRCAAAGGLVWRKRVRPRVTPGWSPFFSHSLCSHGATKNPAELFRGVCNHSLIRPRPGFQVGVISRELSTSPAVPANPIAAVGCKYYSMPRPIVKRGLKGGEARFGNRSLAVAVAFGLASLFPISTASPLHPLPDGACPGSGRRVAAFPGVNRTSQPHKPRQWSGRRAPAGHATPR
jgi:hypothetical protein